MSPTRRPLTPVALLALFCLLIFTTTAPLTAQLLGNISFPNSGADAAQEDFIEGVLYLHNFEYEDARDAFVRARTLDPDFVLAYWGEAMTHNHPVWMRQDREAGLEALSGLAGTPGERREKAGSPRESSYLEALEILFGSGVTEELTKEERDDLYRDAMRRLYEAYPEDQEAAAFYALSILGSAHEGRDFATYMRAAAVADEVWRRNDQHPGAAHYLIHSFDDPVHAPLGLPMARTYAKIAPAAAHAQHMTSHIFVALGLWQDVVDANVIASRVQNSSLAERGRPPRLCGHFPYWLEYGYLQLGRLEDAERLLSACAESVGESDDEGARWHLGAMRARYLIDGGSWAEAEQFLPSAVVVSESSINFAFVDALRGYYLGDHQALGRALERMRGVEEGSEVQEAAVLALELEGLSLLATDPDAAIDALERAVAAEAEMPYTFGPPAIVKPAAELLGEVLLGLGRPALAADTFRRQLDRTPGRVAARLGLARAALAASDVELARETYRGLVAQSEAAGTAPGWLEEARAGLLPETPTG